MATKKSDEIDALIFIDTNILLDFYRIRKSNISLKYIEEIDKHKELIILTSQVEMEYKKNRQSAIIESINELNKVNSININIPTILTDLKSVNMIRKSEQSIKDNQKKLKLKIENILQKPSIHDVVYKKLQNVFNHKSPYILNRDNKKRYTIRRLAGKRFMLGYPPRKKSDNSIGDAINWEWIIESAQTSKKDIIIVTRDEDFGISYNNKSYLNDWLKQEFKQRVSARKKIILTDKLTEAFKLVKIPVTSEMIEEEEQLAELRRKARKEILEQYFKNE